MRTVLIILRWVARIGSLVSYFLVVLFFIGQELSISNFTPTDWIGFLFFPAGVLGGQLLGWRNELVGGVITTVSLLSFYLVYGVLLNHLWPSGEAFIIFSIPGLIFLITGIIKSRISRDKPSLRKQVS